MVLTWKQQKQEKELHESRLQCLHLFGCALLLRCGFRSAQSNPVFSALGERRVGVQVCQLERTQDFCSGTPIVSIQQKLSRLTGAKLGEMPSAVISAPRW